jgi:hypothetical protein
MSEATPHLDAEACVNEGGALLFFQDSMLPTVPYLVIDQNAFRRPHLLNPAIQRASNTGGKLLIIDAAIIEMMKNAQWELTATKSLAGLAGCPALVALGHGIPDLMRAEFRTGQPAYAQLEDVERTASLRALLAELQTQGGGTTPMLDHIKTTIAPAQMTILKGQYLDHPHNKRRVVRFRDAWAKILSAEDRRDGRGNVELQAEWLADPTWSEVVERELLAAGGSVEVARRLAFDRSITAHSLLAMSALALRWLLDNGLDTALAEKITNDVMDGEYVTIGSFCDDVISDEKRVQERLAVVRRAAELRSERVSAVQSERPPAIGA